MIFQQVVFFYVDPRLRFSREPVKNAMQIQ